ncbi:MAG: hypothetical protein E7043_00560 [Lentisphaerae bacterium]|nr:hypothetical protein [Lentisphaerota bacterium]
MPDHTASVLIPAPESMKELCGKLPVNKITTFAVADELAAVAAELEKVFNVLGMNVSRSADKAIINFKYASLPDGAWQMSITQEGITAAAGDLSGASYAAGALAQMLFAATAKSLPDDALDCAEISDKPRFQWRGFMLDSARHYQDKEFVKKFLRILSVFRINNFHWHLVDSQGWRYPSKYASKLDAKGLWSVGQYTLDDLREVSQCARDLGIRIIPEVDVPGHSRIMLANYPEYTCTPEKPGAEFCIGNPETMNFIKNIFTELMEIFPDSPYIHVGGDEADTANWDACPVCRKAMEAKGFSTMRELENDFMIELTRFIISKGRTPIIWGTCSGQLYPADTIVQVWLDIREPLKVIPNGNKIIYSVHNSLYFDYPANLDEPWETWMFELSEKGVYMTDPYIIWPEKVKDATLGTEACLWTETVPQHRVLAKLFPRIFAYSECAWSAPENKSWHDFQRRKELLEAAGYMDYIKSL